MLFRLLGSLEVTVGDRPIRIGTGRQRDVLIMLLLHRNAVVSSERLIDSLWGEHPPATAVKVLQNSVGQLRRVLDDREARRLQTRGHGYLLQVEDAELDVARFERLVREGGRALASDRPADAAAGLREALGLWRGPPLADVAYETFAQAEITRLEEQHAIAIERRIDADLALGAHADLVAELDALIDQHPLREHLRGQRMLALYRCGRQAEALETYREGRRLLVEEVGVEPGTELRGLHDAILRQDPALELKPPELPRELAADGAPALVGRDREMEWLRTHWDEARYGNGRLIALAGEPGMGKTRLAAELAAEVHRAGCAVLHAAGAASSEALVTAIGRACDVGRPTLLVVESAGADGADGAAVRAAADELGTRPILVLLTADEPALAAALDVEASLTLGPLDARALAALARSYAPDAATGDMPADELLEATAGVPGRVQAVANVWAAREATRWVGELAPRAAAGRSELRMVEAGIAGGLLDLQEARERMHRPPDDDDVVVCPFKGLASFEFVDAPYFFGREQLIAELVARSVGAPLLGLVGPSGSGKSSLLRAGLLPAFASGVLPGSAEWSRIVIRPGEHPMRELVDTGLDGAAPGVIAVDQFEELFTACRDERERVRFVEALVHSAREDDGDGLVVLAIRADFYGRCAAYPELSRLLGANHVLVGPMQRDELRRAIERPARRVGLQVEPELVDALVADVEDEPGALPLLSTALLELWQDRDGRRLRLAAYERTGGVRGAVARMAEDAYGGLDLADQGLARRLLLRLAGQGEGGEIVRRRVALAELEGQGGEDLARVLAALTERRLLTMSATTVEVAHEALLREWPRLRGWLDEDAQGRRVQRRLADAARDWDERGHDSSDLYRGARLAVALDWRSGHESELNSTERAFLDAGRTAAERAQRGLRMVLAGVAALLAIAVAGGLVALHQRSSARSEARAAEAQRIGSQALTEPDLARSLLLAAQGVALDDSPATRGNLLSALLRSPAAIDVVRGEGNPLNAIDVDSDGRTLVVGAANGSVVFLDAVTGRRIGRPYRAGGAVSAVRFSPDGTRVAVMGYQYSPDTNGFVELLDARTHRSLGKLDTGFGADIFVDHVGRVVFSPDSRVLAADFLGTVAPAGDRRYAARWDARTGRRLGPPRPITAGVVGAPALVGFISGGTRLVTSSASDNRTVIRDAITLRPLRQFRGGGSPASVSADGRMVALSAPRGFVDLLDLRTGRVRAIGGRHAAPVTAMGFTSDSRRLFTAGGDARLTVWDVEHATAVESFQGLRGRVAQLTIAPDGRTAYSAGQDGSVIGWDLAGTRRLGRPFRVGSQSPTDVLAVTAHGTSLAVPNDAGSIDLLDSRTLTPTRRIPFGEAATGARRPMVVAISPDGHTLAAGTRDGTVAFADPRTGQSLGVPQLAHIGPVLALTFSPDGKWLATSGMEPAIYEWDVRRRTPAHLFRGLTRPATSLSVSPDDTKLAATVVEKNGTGELDILSMPRLALLAQKPATAGLQTQFSRDGRLLFYGDSAGQVWTLDTRTWKQRGPPLAGHANPGSFALSPDDRMLATTSSDGTTQLWDTPSGHPIGTPLPGIPNHPVHAAFVEGGTHLVTLQDNTHGYLWDVQPQSWARRACAIAGRTLTRAEWHNALPERHYAPACAHH